MKRSRGSPIFRGILCGLALLVAHPSAASADESLKQSFKKMGRAIGEAGKDAGQAAAQAGRAIGRESQKVWYRGVQVSKPALEKARADTRRAIRRSLDAMDRSIASLKSELRSLRKEESRGGSDG